MHAGQIVLAPIVSEKSYHGIVHGHLHVPVHSDAHKTQIRQAVEELFEVNVVRVNVIKVQAKPKRRGADQGHARRLEEGDRAAASPGRRIEVFAGSAALMACPSIQADEPGPPLHDGLRLRRGDEVERPRRR